MKILFLDDDEQRHKLFKKAHIRKNVTYIWTAQGAIDALTNEYFDEVSLDHDLAPSLNMQLPSKGDGSGYDVALFISNLSKDKLPKVVILHSFNPAGAKRMYAALRAHERNGNLRVFIKPFSY